ncbi:IS1167, transposase [Streptococcus pneumoniae]|nr:IS1167, transposase [Streptococcus pneumoniae]
MSWDEYAFTKGKMSFIAQDFNNLNIITVLEGRTQAIIRNHFLKYDRAVRCRVKIITMDMFSPYYDKKKKLRFQISRPVIRKLNDFHFKHDFSCLPEIMSWDEYAFTKGKMSFIAQDFNNLNIITVLEGRTQAIIRNHFLKYDRAVRCRVKIITMDMFSPYYDLARQLFPCAKIVLDRFHIVQHLSRAMSRVRVQIMNQLDRKSHEYKAIKRYWKLIQQDSRKLSDKHFYRPTFRMHLTNKEILNKLLSYSQDLKHHYQLYQLLLFHFQNKEPEKFFGLIEDNLKQVHPLFQTVFKTFLKDKEKIVNALQLHYSNAKLEATNNLIKLIKRNAFGFRNFENFKKRIFIALNIKKERTKFGSIIFVVGKSTIDIMEPIFV